MKVLESKKDTELIEFVMNCELDFDFRKHAAMEMLKRAGVTDPWQINQKILNL